MKNAQKRAKTKGVHLRLKVSTIEYLKTITDEDAPTVPAVIRRDIEAKRKAAEKKAEKELAA